MKKIITLIFLLCSLVSGAVKYYCSPAGSDAAAGTIAAPFYSLNQAWTLVAAGDTIYLRGGTYSYTTQQVMTGKNGTAGKLIKVWAYPGETPVIRKGSPYTYDDSYGYGCYFSGNYVHLRGLEICYFTQETEHVWHGLRAYGDHNIFERLNIHHNGSGMILGGTSTDNLILNCDFHHNIDVLSPIPYNNAAGLSTSRNSNTSSINIVRGCRAYWNTDTGFDGFYNEGFVEWDSCWSFYNGYIPDSFTATNPDDMGEGAGWKFGETENSHTGEYKRLITHCIAFHNKAAGFFINDAALVSHMYNNISYNNGWINFCLNVNEAHVVRNNIAYHPGTYNCSVGTNASRVIDHNTFISIGVENTSFSVSDADFVSVDPSGIDGARQSNGSLPALSFLKLVAGSDLIDAGANVGLSYSGTAPDIGAWEYGYAPVIPAPAVSTKKIIKTSGKVLKHNGKFIVR